MFDPAGMRPFIAHWELTAKSLVQRMHRESVGHVTDERTRDLLASLIAYPGVEDALGPTDAAISEPTLPMIPLGFVKDGRALNYFSMVTTVGAPQIIATQELRIECLYPADDETDARHRALMAGAEKP